MVKQTHISVIDPAEGQLEAYVAVGEVGRADHSVSIVLCDECPYDAEHVVPIRQMLERIEHADGRQATIAEDALDRGQRFAEIAEE
jgi:hypothetical protein